VNIRRSRAACAARLCRLRFRCDRRRRFIFAPGRQAARRHDLRQSHFLPVAFVAWADRGIAHPGSAAVLGTAGRWFESSCPDQSIQTEPQLAAIRSLRRKWLCSTNTVSARRSNPGPQSARVRSRLGRRERQHVGARAWDDVAGRRWRKCREQSTGPRRRENALQLPTIAVPRGQRVQRGSSLIIWCG
jgi:hypothetical protein